MQAEEGKAFGELLGRFRTEAKLTQKKLADLIGRSRGTILNWENGTHLPKERALVLDIAKHLHLDNLKRDQLLEAALLDSLGTIWMIPFQRNLFFTGREEVLHQLYEMFDAGTTVALMQPQALKGLGGIGKTHTAVEYAYRYRDDYQTVLWAPSATSATLQASLVSIAAVLNLPQKNAPDQDVIVKAVKEWLVSHTGWLLILDNVEDLADVGLLYPWAHHGHVLITTRSQSIGGIAVSVSLEKMKPDEGALFMLHRAGLIGPRDGKEQTRGSDYEKAMHLSEVLDGLPLALDQAAAYIEKTQCGLSTYLTLYERQRVILLSERGSLTADHPEPVTITFSLAFQKVKQANAGAGELLQFCAFLAPDAIPEEIITHGTVSLGPALDTTVTDLLAFNNAIGMLLAYSLVWRNTDSTTGTQLLNIHRLVQAVLQDEMEQVEKRSWAERAALAINQVFPHVEFATWPQCERLLPHALLAAQWSKKYQINQRDVGSLLHETAFYLFKRARYPEAESSYQDALRIREQQLGPNHLVEIAQSLNNLAILYTEQGKYPEAESLYQRALQIQEQQSEADHLEIAKLLSNLAIVYREQGKYAQAERLLQRSLTIREQLFGPEHLEVTQSVNNLASLYGIQGKYEEAEPLVQRALHVCKRQLGLEHPDTLLSLNNLAALYHEQGKYEEAEPLLQQILTIREKQLDPDHTDIGYPLSNLGNLYQTQGRYEEAEPLLQRALHIWEQRLGPEHHYVAMVMNNLADLYRAQKNYKEAEHFYQSALRIYEHTSGLDRPDAADALDGLAILQELQNKYLEAVPLYQQALVIRKHVYGPQHAKTIKTYKHLHAVFIALGKNEDAEQLRLAQEEETRSSEMEHKG